MNHPTGLAPIHVHVFSPGGRTEKPDDLAIEEPLDIRLGTPDTKARSVAITMRTPGADDQLARGFLFTEGIIPVALPLSITADKENVVTVTCPAGHAIDWQKLQRHSYTSSSCGVCGKTSLEQVFNALPFGTLPGRWQVPFDLIGQLPERLREAQVLFHRTGGIHAAGLFSASGALLHLAEDVGRHNALDKLIGHCHAAGLLPLDKHVLVLSGRASFELVQKAAMAGIAFVVAVGAPSSLAVALAEDQGMTLCGFTRRDRVNCYAGVERVRGSN
ncbi:formate dehydrogenase accessory sulfurtransferase FdhD [Lewinella sp. W8]|uniref:formate dehydrogenase accessory sulfurtransferase FdhD n=1 Tax=Lewinella sp. W8 TaxID=2528208 RepID=UPI00106846A8|nr:formate dehydrogenase accessory sulfurtransferase FdhD [Lewinella sp. W8]MTB52477.1 formate dehydrogenase accessory sulfurtransferase FdhD [Lewinella sp. W8]